MLWYYILPRTLKVSENPKEIDDMQVGIAVSGDDIYSISLSGSLNYWKNARNADDGALANHRYHGHSNLVTCLE